MEKKCLYFWVSVQVIKDNQRKSFDNLGSPEMVILRVKVYKFKGGIYE